MKLFAVILSSALAVMSVDAENIGSIDTTDWLRAAGLAQSEQQQTRFAEAAESAKHALQLAKRFGTSDPLVAISYQLLGSIYSDWKHCADSRTNYTRAIALFQGEAKPSTRHLFDAESDLVLLLCECDDFGAGERTFHAYKPELESYRSTPLDDVKLMSLRALLARHRKDYLQAEVLLQDAVNLLEDTPGSSPFEIAAERGSLAEIWDEEGRHAESLAESERQIGYFEQSSPRHPYLVWAMNNAACSLAGLKRADESEQMFERALAKARDLFGDDNPVTAKIMLSYASVLRANKQLPAAETWQKRGSEAFQRSLRRDNSTIDVHELESTTK